MIAVAFVLLALAGERACAQRTTPVAEAPVEKQPVTTANTKAAKLLKQLDRTSRVAGNVGDVYDNRDRGHSMPRLKWFPQLQQVAYDEAQRKANRDWGLSPRVLPGVVVGNSSTSAPATRHGSNPRQLYVNPRGLALGWNQYVNNNLYVYPEHRDYDTGPLGIGNRGDWYHANTPFLIVSRGSSGSDRPFLHAVFWTLAALRPEVKQQLAENHLLMPAVQMVMRRSLKNVPDDETYLSGVAHPPAFDGERLDPARMVQMAHRISADRLPPLAVMRIISESPSELGRDFFLPNQPERWSQTPGAISRVFRGPRAEYRLVVDLTQSIDLNEKPLTYHWRLLRGDADLVKIDPLIESGRRVALRVRFHNEPITAPDDPGIQSRRVDIGAFVHNGDYYSPPAIVSIYMPPHQRQTVDARGRVVEIGYGAFASPLRSPSSLKAVEHGTGYVKDWPGLVQAFTAKNAAGELLRFVMPPDRREQLAELTDRLAEPLNEFRDRQQALDQVDARWQAAQDPAQKDELDVERRTAQRLLSAARQRLARTLYALELPDGSTPGQWFVQTLDQMRQSPTMYVAHQQRLSSLDGRVLNLRQRLEQLAILVREGDRWAVESVRSGPESLAERLTVFEKNQLAAFHAHLLNQLCGNSLRLPQPMRGDPRVAISHRWRDVYHYDEEGQMIGWTRYGDGEPKQFDAAGQLRETGPDGKAAVRAVNYRAAGNKPWNHQLQMVSPPDASGKAN